MRRFCFLTLAVALAGCAAAPEGARKPPQAWQHAESLSNCGSTDGRFAVVGYPAEENSRSALQSTAWPVLGSLSTMIRTGANGMPRNEASSVSIEIVDGRPRFKGYAADGTELPLMEREWWCDEKALTTRVVLGAVPSEKVPEVRDESVLRLWRAKDGALIAEQTLEDVTPGVLGSSSNHRPTTRSYFRFAPIAVPAVASTAAQ
jgi:hypothetical protein